MERRITVKNKLKRKKLAGFSLLEMLVAIFIFALVITVTISAFVASFNGQKKTKDIQQSMEDARGAIELMAKNIRMGTIDSADGPSDEIAFYNYSQGKCIMYKAETVIDPVTNQSFKIIKTGEAPGPRVTLDDCGPSEVPYTENNLIGDLVVDDLKFKVEKSNYDPSKPPLVVGKVTISIKVKNSAEPIQTTVSLRDYSE